MLRSMVRAPAAQSSDARSFPRSTLGAYVRAQGERHHSEWARRGTPTGTQAHPLPHAHFLSSFCGRGRRGGGRGERLEEGRREGDVHETR